MEARVYENLNRYRLPLPLGQITLRSFAYRHLAI